VEWGEDRNLRWRTALPGEGHSTPVVVGELLFLTAAVPVGEPRVPIPETAEGAHDFRLVTHEHEYRVLAFNRLTGTLQWSTTVCRALPHEGGYITGSYASHSPVTDGRYIYAHFGSRGLYALDLQGKVVWKADLGVMRTHHGHGEGSSPALWKDRLVVNWDQEKDSFIVALDTGTGAEVWRTTRDEVTSWSSPLIVESNGKPQVVVAATNRVRGYDLESGRELWSCSGLSRNVVATPVHDRGMVMVSNSYEWQMLMGIRLAGARGDITGSDQVPWTIKRQTSYVASPVLLNGTLYYLGHLSGLMTGVDTQTGTVVQPTFRLAEIKRVFASPVAAAGRIYVCDQEGATVVLKPGKDGVETLAVNKLNDRFSASPVAVGRDLYLRGGKFLYCITAAQV
jgi:outer membrane protein assembly factor BamB